MQLMRTSKTHNYPGSVLEDQRTGWTRAERKGFMSKPRLK